MGSVSASQIRDVLRCKPTEDLLVFEKFLFSEDQLIRQQASRIICLICPQKVIDVILGSFDSSARITMLRTLGESGIKEIESLMVISRDDDDMVVEQLFQTCLNVGRADLLFPLAIRSDDKTANRVKRYLNEQGYI